MVSGGRSRGRIERKTQELIDRLKDSSKNMLVEKILGCRPEDLRSDIDPLTHLLRSHSHLYADVVKAETKARIQTHSMLLFGSWCLDMHYNNLVGRYQPQSSRTPDVLTDMLTRVCHIMATENPLFAFRPVGVGSHQDGTKTDYSDFDVVFVSLYRPPEDYRVSGCLPKVSIVPVEGCAFYRRCEEGKLLESDGRLDVFKYRDQLRDKLSSVMSAVCSELGLPCGGWNRPHFGDFEENGPAWSVVVDGVSVDITPAFTAPRDIKDEEGRKVMEEIAERVSSAVSSTVSSTVSEDERSDWVNMGLLVLTEDMDSCQLSTSLIEADIIRTVPQLQSALTICKVYRDQFFDLPWPDLRPFIGHLEGKVFEWLASGGCDTLLEALPGDPNRRVVDQLKAHPKYLLLLATQRRPLTLDGNTLEKLETIKWGIGKKWKNYRDVNPSFKSLIVNKPPKPAVKTISFAVKCLLLDKWLNEKRITKEILVGQVMEEYSRRVEEYSRQVKKGSTQVKECSRQMDGLTFEVPHPLLLSLTSRVDVVTFSSFFGKLLLRNRPCQLTQNDMVQQIVSQVRRYKLIPHLPCLPRPHLTDHPIISDDDRQMEVITDTRQQSCQQRMADWWRRCCCCSCCK